MSLYLANLTLYIKILSLYLAILTLYFAILTLYLVILSLSLTDLSLCLTILTLYLAILTCILQFRLFNQNCERKKLPLHFLFFIPEIFKAHVPAERVEYAWLEKYGMCVIW